MAKNMENRVEDVIKVLGTIVLVIVLGAVKYNPRGVQKLLSPDKESEKTKKLSAEQLERARQTLLPHLEFAERMKQFSAQREELPDRFRLTFTEWCEKKSEDGNAKMQSNLGWCYYRGEGVAKNTTEAVFFLFLSRR